MHLNRKLVYDFITKRFNISKKRLAESLHTDESNLSPNRSYDTERLFDTVFRKEIREGKVTEIKLSEAEKAGILDSLKFFLAEHGLKSEMINMWESEYDYFIKELLFRANLSFPCKKSTNGKNSNSSKRDKILTKQAKMKEASSFGQQSKSISLIFKQATQDFGIDPFIETNPLNSLGAHHIEDTAMFIFIIWRNLQRNDISDRNSETCKEIERFIKIITKYTNYLKRNMKKVRTCDDANPNIYTERCLPPDNKKDAFETETQNYRKQLKALLDIIHDTMTKETPVSEADQ